MKINSESIKLELNFHEVISTIFELIDVEVLISIKYFELTEFVEKNQINYKILQIA